MRPISISYDGLAGTDGSGRFSFGPACSALASVSGPLAARLSAEHPSRTTVEVLVRPLAGIPGTHERATASIIRGIAEHALVLTTHPRTLVQIVVQALSPAAPLVPSFTGASSLAAQINAAGLALLSAGSVPLRGVVCAVAVGRSAADGLIVLDPSIEETQKLKSGGCFAFLFSVGLAHAAPSKREGVPPSELLWTNYGVRPGAALGDAELQEAREAARGSAEEIWVRIKESVGAMGTLAKQGPVAQKIENARNEMEMEI